MNRQAVVDDAAAFDFIDGGGLDTVFLGLAECYAAGIVDSSRFGSPARRPAGDLRDVGGPISWRSWPTNPGMGPPFAPRS